MDSKEDTPGSPFAAAKGEVGRRAASAMDGLVPFSGTALGTFRVFRSTSVLCGWSSNEVALVEEDEKVGSAANATVGGSSFVIAVRGSTGGV